MDIVVKGRNVEVPVHYRRHVAEKLRKVEKYDQKLISIDVELFHERNRRQSERCQRVEITCLTRGPVIRAEACAPDFYMALDQAITKLDSRLRRSADRRRVHRGRRAPVSVAAATAELSGDLGESFDHVEPAQDRYLESVAAMDGHATAHATAMAPADEDDQPWHIVREKEHPAEPMTIDDALFQMELIGHDFFLYMDKESGKPSVVYRRKAYDYGVLSLG